jgi:hypothetical protein
VKPAVIAAEAGDFRGAENQGMNAQAAARRLSHDIKAMHSAQTTEKKDLSQLQKQEQAVMDRFTSTPDMGLSQEMALLKQLVSLGQKSATTKDHFDAAIANDRADGRKMLKPAEPALRFKQLNADRKALGLTALKTPPASEQPHKGSKALDVARSHLGKNISYLKYHGSLAGDLDKWPGNNVCCANFVSACLEKAGLIKRSEHNDNVAGLAANLSHDRNWQKVNPSHLKPGDVVAFEVPGEGHYAHTEIFAGYKNGRPTFVGSNNVNADGTQRITEGSAGYHIDAAFRYKG